MHRWRSIYLCYIVFAGAACAIAPISYPACPATSPATSGIATTAAAAATTTAATAAIAKVAEAAHIAATGRPRRSQARFVALGTLRIVGRVVTLGCVREVA